MKRMIVHFKCWLSLPEFKDVHRINGFCLAIFYDFVCDSTEGHAKMNLFIIRDENVESGE